MPHWPAGVDEQGGALPEDTHACTRCTGSEPTHQAGPVQARTRSTTRPGRSKRIRISTLRVLTHIVSAPEVKWKWKRFARRITVGSRRVSRLGRTYPSLSTHAGRPSRRHATCVSIAKHNVDQTGVERAGWLEPEVCTPTSGPSIVRSAVVVVVRIFHPIEHPEQAHPCIPKLGRQVHAMGNIDEVARVISRA